MEPRLAYASGILGAALLVGGIIKLIQPIPEEPTTWTWEHKLLTDLFSGRAFYLCRRHKTALAQARVIGCNIGVQTEQAINHLERIFGVHQTENLIEADEGLRELHEHVNLMEGLHKALTAVKSMMFVNQLQVIAESKSADPGMGFAAHAIIEGLNQIESLVKNFGIDPLQKVNRGLAAELRKNPTQQTGAPQSALIRHAIDTARQSLEDSKKILKHLREEGAKFAQEANKSWEQNAQHLQGALPCRSRKTEIGIARA